MPTMPTMPSARSRPIIHFFSCLICTVLLAACSSVPIAPVGDTTTPRQTSVPKVASAPVPALPAAGSGRGGYYQDDGPGDRVPEGLQAIPDATPRVEPYTRRGNRPYVVFGKTYTPFLDERPFKQRGRGSWYGKKFHGQRTSSGEPYDMYQMSAAHPTMPLPSYARVTNVANGRQVIVRVNDRGPFHADRIIDLSYTAALKLNYLKQGSAEVEVERLLPDEIARLTANRQVSTNLANPASPGQVPPQPPAAGVSIAEAGPATPAVSVFAVPVAAVAEASVLAPVPAVGGFYLQLGAYAQAASAELAGSRLQQQSSGTLPPIEVIPRDGLFRLFSGPFASRDEAAAAAQKIRDAGAARPMIVQR